MEMASAVHKAEDEAAFERSQDAMEADAEAEDEEEEEAEEEEDAGERAEYDGKSRRLRPAGSRKRGISA